MYSNPCQIFDRLYRDNGPDGRGFFATVWNGCPHLNSNYIPLFSTYAPGDIFYLFLAKDTKQFFYCAAHRKRSGCSDETGTIPSGTERIDRNKLTDGCDGKINAYIDKN